MVPGKKSDRGSVMIQQCGGGEYFQDAGLGSSEESGEEMVC